MLETDPIVDAVCAKLQARSAVGLKKYGTTLADNAATVKEKLVHIQEELMDAANYVEWLLQGTEMNQNKLGCAADDDDLCFPCASKGWVCEKAKERAKDMPTPMTIEMEADERQSVIEKALRRAFIIGQNYWSNADSESRSAWKRADKNKEEFELLIKETIRAALQSPRVPDNYIAVPLEPTGPMIMYGIHAHEKNDDLPNIGLGPKCVGIYKAMIKGVRHE